MITNDLIKANDWLRRAIEERQYAEQNWNDAVKNARYHGLTYTEIGKQVHLTEAAIRLYCKRHGIK